MTAEAFLFLFSYRLILIRPIHVQWNRAATNAAALVHTTAVPTALRLPVNDGIVMTVIHVLQAVKQLAEIYSLKLLMHFRYLPGYR